MKRLSLLFIFLTFFLLAFQPARAQSAGPLVLVMKADGAIFPAMREYIDRGIKVAEQRDAELLVIQLNTPGGSIDTMNQIIELIRSSTVPVAVYISPRGAWAASAGTLVTLAGHVAVMAPETTIGSASPVDSSGGDLDPTMKAKVMEALTAKVRALTASRGEQATKLAESMIVDAKSVTAQEALDAHLIDFIANDTNDLLAKLDGFQVETTGGARLLHTSNAHTEPLDMSLIEQLLLILTDSSIVFLLGTIGLILLWIEISSPGGWVAGFSGVVCLALSAYGLGIIPVNWFGIVFIITAFALFILDVKAPTHGALTTAGAVSFIVGALVLFNSPVTPVFLRIPVPLVVGMGVAFGAAFFGIMLLALRVRHSPVLTGVETLAGKTGTAQSSVNEAGGQVQVGAELWSAESAPGSDVIRKGDHVEVVEVKGLRLKVRKK
jgi:membrane-bound serine protease (ClpP class)